MLSVKTIKIQLSGTKTRNVGGMEGGKRDKWNIIKTGYYKSSKKTRCLNGKKNISNIYANRSSHVTI